jgi:hypothetical protein
MTATEENIDIRDIEPEFFSAWSIYSDEEKELFKRPSKTKHYIKRLDLMLKNRFILAKLGIPNNKSIIEHIRRFCRYYISESITKYIANRNLKYQFPF